MTCLGARLLADWLAAPLTDVAAINARLDAVAELVADSALTSQLRESLKQIYDIQRLLARVTTGRASPRDLSFVGRTLACLPKVKAKLTGRAGPLLQQIEQRLDLCADVRGPLEQALVDELPAHGPRRRLHPQRLSRRSRRAARADGRRQAVDGRVPGGRMPADRHREHQGRLQPGVRLLPGSHARPSREGAGRIHPQANAQERRAVRHAGAERVRRKSPHGRGEGRRQLEYDMFVQLRDLVARAAHRLQATADALAEVDVLASLAELARSRNYVRPTIVAEPVLDIEAGRHPVLDITEPDGTFVPNGVQCGARTANDECRMTNDECSRNSIRIRHSPGDSCSSPAPTWPARARTFARRRCLVLMAQMGSFVPARRATIGVADRIFARVGASDELSRGQSTFMVEMTETARILNTATRQSLVILDEIGRGTSTYDGLSLAWSIVEHIHESIGCRTLFATHYHELTDLEEQLAGVRNFNVAVKEWDDQVVFLHQIVPGAADKSYGIHVAQLAGVPRSVNERAREVLAWLESQHDASAACGLATKAQKRPGYFANGHRAHPTRTGK